MIPKVFITGYGIISGIGCGENETLHSLQEKSSGIGNVSFLKTALSHHPVAEIKKTNEELCTIADIPYQASYSRTFLLGLIAAQQAVKMASCERQLSSMGILGSTTVAGMDLNEQFFKDLTRRDYRYLDMIPSFECADSTDRIAGYFGITSNVITMSTACSSSANTIMVGARMIKNGLLDRVLVGGMDSLTRFTLNGFNSLEILSPTGCKPFDRDRNGVTIGEGAAFLVLESEKAAAGKNVYGEIAGYANKNEAFHQTASSPDGSGAIMTITKALEVAGLKPENIDYINAHGTGTEINDLSEGNAINTVFKEKMPLVSSTKGYTGHTLAAAGVIEAVLSVLSLKEQLIFPNLRMSVPMEGLLFNPVTETRNHAVENILSNSFGFGGSNSTLIFSKV
jgi:3-oxoacyl-[acyl-carrier-protein] synthase-1